MFKVAIIGGENTMNFDLFREKCIYYLREKAKDGIRILTTGDEYIDHFARMYHIDVQCFLTNWQKYKNNALKVRNDELLKDCDALIYFDDKIKDNSIIYTTAQSKNIPTRLVSL